MTDPVSDHLAHYGVKGMRWGVRRKRGSNGRVGGSKPSGKTTFQKQPHRLSDAELQRRIKRMELEKKYRELNAPTKSKGRKFAGEVVENSGKTIVGTVVGTTASFAVGRALKKKFGSG